MIAKENNEQQTNLTFPTDKEHIPRHCVPQNFSVEDNDDDDYSDPDLSYDSYLSCSEDSNCEDSDDDNDETRKFFSTIHSQLLREEKTLDYSVEKITTLQDEITIDDVDSAALWILKVNANWGFPSDVCFTAITYLHILLSCRRVEKCDLLLMAATCFRIAAKIDLKRYPSTQQINEATGEKFAVEKLNLAEIKIIEALGFKLTYPTIKKFMKRYIFIAKVNEVAYFISGLIAEKVAVKHEFIKYNPSVIAAAIIATALGGTGEFIEARRVIIDSQCTDIEKMRECVQRIIEIGSMIKMALSHFNRESDPIVKFLEAVDFNFKVSQIVL